MKTYFYIDPVWRLFFLLINSRMLLIDLNVEYTAYYKSDIFQGHFRQITFPHWISLYVCIKKLSVTATLIRPPHWQHLGWAQRQVLLQLAEELQWELELQ